MGPIDTIGICIINNYIQSLFVIIAVNQDIMISAIQNQDIGGYKRLLLIRLITRRREKRSL